MPSETKNGMRCNDFEALLSEALDQKLAGAKLESFQGHIRVCPMCGPLFAEVEAGQRWLKALEEVEPPSSMVRDILLVTTGVRPSWWEKLTTTFFAPIVAAARQPRFAMSFGMAFFSLSLALNVSGVRLSGLRQLDLRPSAIKRSYYETSGKVQRYYDNIRFVYEIESRVREFKRATTPPEPAPPRKEREPKNNTSGQPEPKQERNYSQSENQPVLASGHIDPPVMSVTTYRRRV
jgi:hypothetical protein